MPIRKQIWTQRFVFPGTESGSCYNPIQSSGIHPLLVKDIRKLSLLYEERQFQGHQEGNRVEISLYVCAHGDVHPRQAFDRITG
jgi:hypothetical protein